MTHDQLMILGLRQARYEDDTHGGYIVVHQVDREPTAMASIRGEWQTFVFRFAVGRFKPAPERERDGKRSRDGMWEEWKLR